MKTFPRFSEGVSAVLGFALFVENFAPRASAR